MRLDRRLSELALGTRKEVQEIVRRGRVQVNGVSVRDSGMHTEDTDVLCVDGKVLDARRERHIMLNKPEGVLTAARDKKQRTVMDLLEPVHASLSCMPVGRLDRDTTGLLLFTTDGELSHRLLSPARHVDKVYRAVTDLPLSPADVEVFSAGMDLGDFVAAPAGLVIEDTHTATVTVHEGKFHQVRRMFEKVGKTVVKLDRIAFGPLTLDTALARSAWRELADEEIMALYQHAGMEHE